MKRGSGERGTRPPMQWDSRYSDGQLWSWVGLSDSSPTPGQVCDGMKQVPPRLAALSLTGTPASRTP